MNFTVESNISLLDALRAEAPESSKNTLRGWISEGRVYVEGKPEADPRTSLTPGQRVQLGPRKIFLREGVEVLFEDRHLVVVYKPEGLLSVATDFDKTLTVHALLKERFYTQMVYPVHRLDRETSGVMVYAYSEKARGSLKQQFADHSILREYWALVEGKPAEERGTWKSCLEEDESYFVKSGQIGKLAITHYEVSMANASHALLRLNLETGRKNQIRVHCSEAGHPIAGDKKYGAKTNPHGRLCLHAKKLGFTHPQTGKRCLFESALPASFPSN